MLTFVSFDQVLLRCFVPFAQRPLQLPQGLLGLIISGLWTPSNVLLSLYVLLLRRLLVTELLLYPSARLSFGRQAADLDLSR